MALRERKRETLSGKLALACGLDSTKTSPRCLFRLFFQTIYVGKRDLAAAIAGPGFNAPRSRGLGTLAASAQGTAASCHVSDLTVVFGGLLVFFKAPAHANRNLQRRTGGVDMSLKRFASSMLLVCSFIPYQIATAEEQLSERAPHLHSLHDLLAEKLPDDREDLDELDAEIKETIAELERTLESHKNELLRSRDLFEIGLWQRRQSDILRLRTDGRIRADFDRYFIGANANPPAPSHEAISESLRRSLSLFRDLLANNPNHRRRDELNFLISSTLARVGNDHCEAYFKQAIQHAKDKGWALRSKLARADYLVTKARLAEAETLYQEALTTGEPRLKAYAHYRLGWLRFHAYLSAAGEGRRVASKAMRQHWQNVIVIAQEEDLDSETNLALGQIAAMDLLWLLALEGDKAGAQALMSKLDLQHHHGFFLDKLARAAINLRQLKEAEAIYQDLLAEHPDHPDAPDFALRLARAFYLEGRLPDVKRQQDKLRSMSSNPADPWYDTYSDDESRFSRLKQLTALLPLTGGLTLARAAERETDAKRRGQLLQGAIDQLSAYLKQQPKAAEATTIKLSLASLLITATRTKEALALLDQLSADQQLTKEQSLAAKSERLRLVVQMDAAQNYPALPQPGEVKKPIPLPDLKKRFAVYAEDFLSAMPESEDARALRYRIAQTLFLYGHYQEALKRFENLVAAHAGSEEAKVAIEVLLSMNLKWGLWDELVRLSTDFLNNRAVKGKALRDYVRENLDYAKAQKAQRG